ncbi:gag polymerase env [Lasallia pustulata]|uniref:Gag polymerase env n=1 Tax=Lasallia pustulata TaxID=136370 RepID=A0A1W5CSG6_9LECA|nr:gag polymerase env [Lasallia pustulata]
MTIQEMEKALSEQTADNTSEVNISVLSMEEVLAKIEIEGDQTKLPQSWVHPISNYKLQKLKEYLDENLKKGFISPSHAPYASPVLFAVKPNGSLRVCVDYQKLNAITKRNRYPIPLIEETLAKVTGCKYITKLDVIAAFNKLRMHPNSEDYTTFITSMGAYKYHVLPFGLTNSPANYQHYMNNVLWDHLNNFCSAYLDDTLIYSKTLKEHTQHAQAVLQKLIDAGLQVDIEKCKFHVQETSFLGVLLSTDGLRMDPKKVQVVVDWSTPTNLKQVQAFIGFCNFYRRFIKGFSKIVGPMLKLTQKGVIFQWTDTYSSDHVNAGVLSQYDDDKVLHPVAFYSKNMVPAECNYKIYDKELLAIICCLKHWRPELEATELPVEIFTDHKALEHFMTSKELTRR